MGAATVAQLFLWSATSQLPALGCLGSLHFGAGERVEPRRNCLDLHIGGSERLDARADVASSRSAPAASHPSASAALRRS